LQDLQIITYNEGLEDFSTDSPLDFWWLGGGESFTIDY